MFEFWAYGFMQRAFMAGIVAGILCPTIGIYLVLRRLSLVGEMFAHVSLAGVALGMFAGLYPMATALFLSLGAALGLEMLRRTYRILTDLAIAIMISAGISLAVILISMSDSFNLDLFSYLFGSVVAISATDLRLMVIVGVVIVAVIFLLQKELFFIAFDEEAAKAAGIRVELINTVFVVATALTISVAMRVVGVLLVSSLITVPVAAALQIGRGFRDTAAYSYLFALLSVLIGLFASYHLDLASGGSIVMVSLILLLIAIGYRKLAGSGVNWFGAEKTAQRN